MLSRSSLNANKLIFAITASITFIGLAFAFEQKAAVDNEKVGIALYYESQCPGCRDLITTSFKEAFQADGFLDMADVEFVPYGNAQETKTDTGMYKFECQHGPSECIYNTIETCALAKIEDPLVAFQYIDCIERSDESRDPKQDYYTVAMHCCKLVNLPEATILQMEGCATGGEGNELEHKAAEKTDGLVPPHQYVPYVTVNGVHTDKTQDAISDSLFNYVCDVYLGPNKSLACPGMEMTTTTNLRASSVSSQKNLPLGDKKICYRKDGPTQTVTNVSAESVAEE